MQQTNNYKLNLIEPSDTFSPDPLNENMEKLESALDAAQSGTDAEAAARAAAVAALDQRLAVFEARKYALGMYGHNPNGITIDVGFQPKIVFIHSSHGWCGVLMPDEAGFYQYGKLTSTGFNVSESSSLLNSSTPNSQYIYLAIA